MSGSMHKRREWGWDIMIDSPYLDHMVEAGAGEILAFSQVGRGQT